MWARSLTAYEVHAGVFHQEADGIAILAAAKAVEELLGGADREGGRLLGMEGAQAHEIGAAFFQCHMAAHHLDHVGTGDEFLDEVLGNGHGAIVGDLGQRG